jgi:hypothetical protein
MHQLTECSACPHNAGMPNNSKRGFPLSSSHSMTHGQTIAWLRQQQSRISDARVSGAEMVREARVERMQQTWDRMGLAFDADEDFPV